MIDAMTVLQCLVFIIAIDIITMCTFVFFYIKKKKNKTGVWCLTVLSICATLFIGFNIQKAYRHGMYEIKISFSDMLKHIEKSPEEDRLPKNLSKCIIIYYKFGCSDCEHVYKDLKASLGDKQNVYWVSTRSKQGMDLLNHYPVKVVPSGVYVYSDSTTTAPQYVKKVLYMHDKNETILHQTNLNRLLELQSEER